MRLLRYIKKEPILLLATLLAVSTCFFVPPNFEYINYINFKTIVCLFCLMISVRGLRSIKVFKILAVKILPHIHSTRGLILTLVFLPAFFALFITNDVAVLTFVPFAIIVLSMCDMSELTLKTVILITIGCNLSGLISPIGNSQNLYLFSFYNLETIYLIKYAYPTAIVGFALLFFLCFKTNYKRIETFDNKKRNLNKTKLFIYVVLLILSISAVVVRINDYYWIIFGVVILTMMFCDRGLFRQVNYSIIFTFIAFFIFSGNLKNIPIVAEFLQKIITGNEYILSIGISQLVSNTPATILLSSFSNNALPLLLGLNIGKNGTIIASMTGVFALTMYSSFEHKPFKFLLKFSLYGFLFVLVLGITGIFNIMLMNRLYGF